MYMYVYILHVCPNFQWICEAFEAMSIVLPVGDVKSFSLTPSQIPSKPLVFP